MALEDWERGLNLDRDQKELQPHGTSSFPCAGYSSVHTSRPEDILPWHWHEELEIIYIAKGTMLWRIPGASHYLSAGDIAILNGNILHYAEGAPAASLRSFIFSPLLVTGSTTSVFFEKYIMPLMNLRTFSCVIYRQDQEMQALFSEAFEALEKETFAFEFVVREDLSRMLLRLFDPSDNELVASETACFSVDPRTVSMLTFVHDHYSENITLNDISASAHVSERECLRCFRRTIGESPIRYLLKYRLMHSAYLLASEPHLSMSEIASACGFDAPSYFTKQFKKHYLCTPSKYRKKSRKT